MDIFEQIKQYVFMTNNCQGKWLTQNIQGVTSSVDTLSFHYSNKGSAARVAEEIDNEFSVITNVLDDLAVGITTVFIIVIREECHGTIR
jgi:hypothetical protein